MGPFLHDDPHPDTSALFLHRNTNKRGNTLDLASAAGKKVFRKLVEHADILVENFSPRLMPSLGVAYDVLKDIKPALVMTSISNFGQAGPYRDCKFAEIVASAMGGPMNMDGLSEREPLKQGGNAAQYQAGAAAAVATRIVLWKAAERGAGDHVDCSLMRTQAANVDRRTAMLITYQYTGMVGGRTPPSVLPALGMHPLSLGVGLVGYAGAWR